MNKRLAPLRAKNDARNSVEIAWTNEQKQIVTSYDRNKNLDDEIKNQEKANNSLSYRFAAIKKTAALIYLLQTSFGSN